MQRGFGVSGLRNGRIGITAAPHISRSEEYRPSGEARKGTSKGYCWRREESMGRQGNWPAQSG